tara:strand:+ start:282 stop:710 length:429 start_codon:yes stop_codon:yes gene_type:complete
MDKKEKRKLYMKQYNEDNKEKIKLQSKQYRENNKERIKQYRENNKEEMKQYRENHKEEIKQYGKTPQRKKSKRISSWKHQGIIFFDYELLYQIYMETTNCDECKCLLNQCTKSVKCVDHDHSIKDCDNVRNILCSTCNTKRG